jgi:hypothetical protein
MSVKHITSSDKPERCHNDSLRSLWKRRCRTTVLSASQSQSFCYLNPLIVKLMLSFALTPFCLSKFGIQSTDSWVASDVESNKKKQWTSDHRESRTYGFMLTFGETYTLTIFAICTVSSPLHWLGKPKAEGGCSSQGGCPIICMSNDKVITFSSWGFNSG